jgi:hypothetical protein
MVFCEMTVGAVGNGRSFRRAQTYVRVLRETETFLTLSETYTFPFMKLQALNISISISRTLNMGVFVM